MTASRMVVVGCLFPLLACSSAHGGEGGRPADLELRQRAEAELHAQQEASIRKSAQEVVDRGDVEFRSATHIESLFFDRSDRQLLTLSVKQRREFSERVLGKSLHSALLGIAIKHLDSATAPDGPIPAIQLLGTVLFAEESLDVVRSYAFHADERVQLHALCSLCSLSVPGARGLLHYALLSGVVDEMWMRRALKVLAQYDEHNLSTIGAVMLRRHCSPIVVEPLLPVLLKNDDYLQVIEVIFGSGLYDPPDKKELDLKGGANLNITAECLETLRLRKAELADSAVVRKRVFSYAESVTHFTVYGRALRLLEAVGTPTSFFEGMAARGDNPPLKAEALRLLIERRKAPGGEGR